MYSRRQLGRSKPYVPNLYYQLLIAFGREYLAQFYLYLNITTVVAGQQPHKQSFQIFQNRSPHPLHHVAQGITNRALHPGF